MSFSAAQREWLSFFAADALYKLVANDDVSTLDLLHKVDHRAIYGVDSAGSNVFHFAASRGSPRCIEWALGVIGDNAVILEMLRARDRFGWTPVTLCKAIMVQNGNDSASQIDGILSAFVREHGVDEEKKEKATLFRSVRERSNCSGIQCARY